MKARLCLVALVLQATSAWAACEKLPAPVTQYLQANPQWRLVDMKDLDAEDQGLWRKHRGDLCPGFATANLDASRRPSYALALRSKTPGDAANKAIVLQAEAAGHSAKPLAPADNGRARVIWRAGPDVFKDFYSGAQTRVAHDVFIYERIGSNSRVYYLSNGNFRNILVSD